MTEAESHAYDRGYADARDAYRNPIIEGHERQIRRLMAAAVWVLIAAPILQWVAPAIGCLAGAR